MESYTRMPRSRRPVAVEDDQADDESSYSIFLLFTPVGFAISDCEKAEGLAI